MRNTIDSLKYVAMSLERAHPLASETCKAALAEIAILTDERDLLRDALETMLATSPCGVPWRFVCDEARSILELIAAKQPQGNPQ
jgi:hypothetical protein